MLAALAIVDRARAEDRIAAGRKCRQILGEKLTYVNHEQLTLGHLDILGVNDLRELVERSIGGDFFGIHLGHLQKVAVTDFGDPSVSLLVEILLAAMIFAVVDLESMLDGEVFLYRLDPIIVIPVNLANDTATRIAKVQDRREDFIRPPRLDDIKISGPAFRSFDKQFRHGKNSRFKATLGLGPRKPSYRDGVIPFHHMAKSPTPGFAPRNLRFK